MGDLKYKVGDSVRIKDIDWYNENKNKYGNIKCGYVAFTSDMSIYCGELLTICDIKEEFSCYHMKKCKYMFTDEMIEGLVEEENILKTQSDNMETDTYRGYYTNEPETTSEGKKVAWFTFWDNDFADKVELDLSNRELIQEDGKWFVVKKKEYPKTYEECCKILGCKADHFFTDFSYKGCDVEISDYEDKIDDLLRNFRKLRYCRDAYWKIAGDEMGLDKPWEPDWREKRYIIYQNQDDIIGGYREAGFVEHHIFEFPTKEMRDAFKENFKKEIEICKEIL